MRILVTGATGNVGSALAAQLVAAGHETLGLVRSGSEARLPSGTTPVVGDLNDPASFAAALDGTDGLFLLSGYAGAPDLLAAAKAAGVGRVALLSSGAVGASTIRNAIVEYNEQAEAEVRASGIPHTALRPHMFMTNAFQWRPQLLAGDTVRVAFADVPAAVLDPEDLAAVAAVTLTGPDAPVPVRRLTGPAPLTAGERLAVLGDVLGRELRLEPIPDDVAWTEMTAETPERYVTAFFDFYVRRSYDEGAVHPGVRDATGRDPRTFRAWAEEHAGRFR